MRNANSHAAQLNGATIQWTRRSDIIEVKLRFQYQSRGKLLEPALDVKWRVANAIPSKRLLTVALGHQTSERLHPIGRCG